MFKFLSATRTALHQDQVGLVFFSVAIENNLTSSYLGFSPNGARDFTGRQPSVVAALSTG